MSTERNASTSPTTEGATVGTAVGTATAGVGAAVTATLASVCCTGPVIAPIVVGLLGAAGAAAAAGLKPYTPYLFAGSLAMLAFGFWTVNRARKSCAVGAPLRLVPFSLRFSRAVLWLAAGLWVASVAFTLYSLRTS
ncbi:MAG: hypothetical protein GIW99_01350 [Candidatus Eremiobacteraeota bacterium]|nr:hypothetical protein [Candidatus Eremiobacteraeota bacterium]